MMKPVQCPGCEQYFQPPIPPHAGKIYTEGEVAMCYLPAGTQKAVKLGEIFILNGLMYSVRSISEDFSLHMDLVRVDTE